MAQSILIVDDEKKKLYQCCIAISANLDIRYILQQQEMLH